MTLITQLTTLENSGLIHLVSAQPSVDYLFRHALIQEAAYRSLTKHDRTDLHRVVGETIEQLYPDRLTAPDLAPRLAQHFDRAGDVARALKYYALAGDMAYQGFANAEAIVHYARAIELAKSATHLQGASHISDWYIHRGRALEHSGEYERARDNYLDMEQTAQQRDDRSMELAALMANTTIHSAPTSIRNTDIGQELATRSLTLAQDLNDRAAEAKIYWNLILLNRHLGNVEQALNFGERSIAIARELNLRDQLALSLNDIMASYWLLGQRDQARAALVEASQLFRAENNLPMLADSLSTRAMFDFMYGRYDSSLAVSAESYELSVSIGNLWNQSYSYYVAGYIYLERGEIDQALVIMERTVTLGAQAGFAFALAQTQTDLAFVYATLGDYERALEITRRAIADTERLLPNSTAYPLGLLAHIHFLQGHLAEAEEDLQLAAINFKPSEATILGYTTPLADMEIALAKQDYDHILHATAEMLQILDRLEFKPFRSDALRFKGLALMGQQKLDEAETVLQAARAVAEALNSRRSLWPICVALSDLAKQRGQSDQAAAYRSQAREIIDYFADHISDPKLRKSFLNLPDVKATQ